MPKIPPGMEPRDLTTAAGRLGAAWDALRGRPFGPGQPMEPYGPEGKDQLVEEPRQFQYPVRVNTSPSPRREYPTLNPFAQLRNLATLYDVAAMCIATRIEEMQGLQWAVVARNKRQQAKLQKWCDALTTFWQSPDRLNDFSSWLAMILDEMYSIDALTLYKRPNRGGGLYALEPVDGTTMKPLLDQRGRTVAYQQIVYGYPESQYRRPSAEAPDEQLPIYAPQELMYKPRWTRTFTPYGYPPTERIILRVNQALRKQSFDLAYFTDGNVPEGLIAAPEGLTTPEQIAQFEEYFNAILEGSDAARRRIKFMPWGATLIWGKQFSYDPALDRWLLGITCASYGVMPHELGFVEDINRSQGKEQEDLNQRRGLRPLGKWLKEAIFDPVIQNDMRRPDLEWRWFYGESEDDESQAVVDRQYWDMGVVSSDELRQMRFADELDGPAPTAAPNGDPTQPEPTMAAPTTIEGDVQPVVKRLAKRDRNRAAWEEQARQTFRRIYQAQMNRSINSLDKLTEAELASIESELADFWQEEPHIVEAAIRPFLQELASDAALHAIERVGLGGADWEVINTNVLAVARERARLFAEEMTTTSQAQVANVVADWIAKPSTMPELIDRVGDVWTGPRPDIAARFELVEVYTKSQIEAWKVSGVVTGYHVETANDSHVRPTHTRVARGGPYPLDDSHHLPPINGDFGCRCDVAPVVRRPGA